MVVLEGSTGSKILWVRRRSSTSTLMHYLRSPWACSRSPCWILWPLMKSQWTGSMMVMIKRPTSWAWLKGLRC